MAVARDHAGPRRKVPPRSRARLADPHDGHQYPCRRSRPVRYVAPPMEPPGPKAACAGGPRHNRRTRGKSVCRHRTGLGIDNLFSANVIILMMRAGGRGPRSPATHVAIRGPAGNRGRSDCRARSFVGKAYPSRNALRSRAAGRPDGRKDADRSFPLTLRPVRRAPGAIWTKRPRWLVVTGWSRKNAIVRPVHRWSWDGRSYCRPPLIQ